MVRKLIVIGIMILFISPGLTNAMEISGIQVPESLDQVAVSLELNGAGVRSRFFFDLYVIALYIEIKSQDAEKILRDDMPMGIRLYVVSSLVDNEKLREALTEGLENATGGNIQPIQSQFDRLMELLSDGVNKGDVFDFIYLPDVGLKIYQNDTFKDDIKGLNFKRAFFGIWLGDDPVDEDLKQELLGL